MPLFSEAGLEAASEREPLTTWSQETAEELSRAQLTGGWMRALPATGLTILQGATLHQEPVSLALLGSALPVDPTDDPWTAPCWYAEEADNVQKVAALDAYAAYCDFGPVRTCRQLLALLIAAKVIYEDGERIGPMYPLPGVDEVFPVAPAEKAALEKLRADFG
ncbi:DUF6042 family protein [Streptomyces sp. NPDC058412]|uniref:DUF6042 family protein n=1 Tax=Streptomyces sp. NPDC058412 TaxID=3346486 RepID=UPI003660257C